MKTVTVKALDNSQEWPVIAEDTTLHRNAVAFEVWLSDEEVSEWACLTNSYGYNELYACECVSSYKAKQNIDSIQIISIGKYNEDIYQNQIINKFCFAESVYNSTLSDLYISMDELVESLNNLVLSGSMVYKFRIFLNSRSIYRSAHFDFKIYLSDGSIISRDIQIIIV
ncbi:MAG: DUF5034 domain-containing protein [Bacteroidales bacterium]|nr:DUF5034 domain-containing protein [Bacteroidales bacterium]MBN2817405.1 DUF5034 domain-containing protein [Bacteroidales bacterium]